eukprot:956036_1
MNCPNYPDACVQIMQCCYTGTETVISSYNAIQLQVDIVGFRFEIDDEDACEIWWDIDNSGVQNLYHIRYPNGVFKDVIIDIPLPNSYTSININLQIHADMSNDMCFFDNAILRGISITKQPSQSTTAPTSDPTTSYPSYLPTLSPTKNPSTKPTLLPTKNPTTIKIYSIFIIYLFFKSNEESLAWILLF